MKSNLIWIIVAVLAVAIIAYYMYMSQQVAKEKELNNQILLSNLATNQTVGSSNIWDVINGIVRLVGPKNTTPKKEGLTDAQWAELNK